MILNVFWGEEEEGGRKRVKESSKEKIRWSNVVVIDGVGGGEW